MLVPLQKGFAPVTFPGGSRMFQNSKYMLPSRSLSRRPKDVPWPPLERPQLGIPASASRRKRIPLL